MKAKDLGRVNEQSAKGVQKLYEMDPPLKDFVYDWSEEDDVSSYQHVVVSAVTVYGEPETYIFPANSEGEITGWGELPGSKKGTLSHEKVIMDLGYEIV